MAQNISHTHNQFDDEALLRAVAEHIKQPLLVIRQAAELASQSQQQLSTADIFTAANAGLQMVEHYTTWQRYNQGAAELKVQQVSLSAVMREVEQQLRSITGSSQRALELKIKGRYEPVLAEATLLSSGLHALGMSVIEAAPKEKIVLGVHKTRWGIVAGVYAPGLSLQSEQFNIYKHLVGRARQLMPSVSHSPMSGVAIADALFSQMFLRMHVSKHNGMHGLAVTLAPSPQLSLL